MLKWITNLLLFIFCFNSFALPLKKASDVSEVMQKYDYMLTAHPEAHDKSFRAKTMEDFKEELMSSVSKANDAELQIAFDSILNEIPSQEKRETYLKVLKNSSKEEVASYLTDPKLLEDALRGESANFFITGDLVLDIALILIGALILYAIIEAIVFAIKYKKYESTYSFSWGGACTISNMEYNYSYYEIEAIKDNAYNKCRNEAEHPSTCSWAGWSWSEDSTYDEYYDTSF